MVCHWLVPEQWCQFAAALSSGDLIVCSCVCVWMWRRFEFATNKNQPVSQSVSRKFYEWNLHTIVSQRCILGCYSHIQQAAACDSTVHSRCFHLRQQRSHIQSCGKVHFTHKQRSKGCLDRQPRALYKYYQKYVMFVVFWRMMMMIRRCGLYVCNKMDYIKWIAWCFFSSAINSIHKCWG